METKNQQHILQLISYFPKRVADSLILLDKEWMDTLTEIRIRQNLFICLYFRNEQFFLCSGGKISKKEDLAIVITTKEYQDLVLKLCEYSIYTYQDQIVEGFITIKTGHRVGVCGTAVYKNNCIINIKNISSLNIRIKREVIGCSERLADELLKNFKSTLIVSPPAGGKTTIIRDLALQLSRREKKVCVIDERGEIGAVFNGISQNDLGLNTDVLDGYKKAEGIMIAIRSLSPDVIICDEISSESEIAAIYECFKNGVCVIASIHGDSVETTLKRKYIKELCAENIIEHIVELSGAKRPGEIKRIVSVSELCRKEYFL